MMLLIGSRLARRNNWHLMGVTVHSISSKLVFTMDHVRHHGARWWWSLCLKSLAVCLNTGHRSAWRRMLLLDLPLLELLLLSDWASFFGPRHSHSRCEHQGCLLGLLLVSGDWVIFIEDSTHQVSHLAHSSATKLVLLIRRGVMSLVLLVLVKGTLWPVCFATNADEPTIDLVRSSADPLLWLVAVCRSLELWVLVWTAFPTAIYIDVLSLGNLGLSLLHLLLPAAHRLSSGWALFPNCSRLTL